MNALGKYCHDFPRLAKESGYMFQLHRGRINWSDLDKVNVQKLVDERNFQLLEQNLIHVINCNLEREYDVKILDENFVKLFKLAQLGIDYLSYCELYLDRCVILLQEQLSSCQEEYALLKEENGRKEEELKKLKKKVKAQSENCRCSKCKKIFLNESYLESHEKRRHRNESETNKNNYRSCADHAQQTEEQKTYISVYTQTSEDKTQAYISVLNSSELVKSTEQEVKIENLKRDLEELKIRLSLAEKSMEEKKQDEKTFQSNFRSALIPVIHSYITPPYSGYVPVNSTPPTGIPSIPKEYTISEHVPHTEEISKKTTKTHFNEVPTSIQGDTFSQTKLEEPIVNKSVTPERFSAEGASTARSESVNSNETLETYDQAADIPSHISPERSYVGGHVLDVQPILYDFPRNVESKKNVEKKPKKSEITIQVEDVINDIENSTPGSSPKRFCEVGRFESDSLSESLVVEPRTSTPVKGTSTAGENEMELDAELNASIKGVKRERRKKSLETPVKELNFFNEEGKSKSLLRKIVTKKPPKLQELTVNLKNSFSQLYDSVSSVGRRNGDVQEENQLEATKSHVVEGLHRRLKELGIDPEWSGIPKETMKQKLKILEHHRNLLSKESHLYPYLRRKIQKHVLKRLKTKSLSSKEKVQTSAELIPSDNGEPSGSHIPEKLTDEGTNEITIYDTDGESEIEEKETKNKFSQSPNKGSVITSGSFEAPNKSISKSEEKKEEERETTDFSIFQAGKFKATKPKTIQLEIPPMEADEKYSEKVAVESDSDFDDDLFNEFQRESFPGARNKPGSPSRDIIASFPVKEESFREKNFRLGKLESQSILKSELDGSKSQLTGKKKVLFAEEPEIFDSGPKTSIEKQKILDLAGVADDDDDDWSIESEWTINNAS